MCRDTISPRCSQVAAGSKPALQHGRQLRLVLADCWPLLDHLLVCSAQEYGQLINACGDKAGSEGILEGVGVGT